MLPSRRTPMKRALALLAIFLVIAAAILPGPVWAAGGWHHGHHGGHGGWWWPAALIGGIALGAVTIATAPLWALAPPPPAAYPPVVVEAPSAAYVQPVYSTSPGSYQQAPGYARPEPPPFQRAVVYADGRDMPLGGGVLGAAPWVWDLA